LENDGLTSDREHVVEAPRVVRIKIWEDSFEEKCRWFEVEAVGEPAVNRARAAGDTCEYAFFVERSKAKNKSLGAGEVEVAKDIEAIDPLIGSKAVRGLVTLKGGPEIPEEKERRAPDSSSL